MFYGYENIVVSILFTIVIVLSFVFIKKYIDRYKYSFESESDIVYKNTEKYKLFFLILGIYIPLTEIPIYFFNIREKQMLIENIVMGVICLLYYFGSLYNKILLKYISQVFVIFYFAFTVFTIYTLYKYPYSLIAISEFLMVLIFSTFSFYKRGHYLAYVLFILSLFFYLEYDNAITIKQLTVYSYLILIVFLINYGRASIDYNIYLNLYISYYAINKGNLFSIGIDEHGKIQFISDNFQELLIEKKSKYLGKNLKEILNYTIEELTLQQNNDGEIVTTIEKENGETIHIQWHINTQRKDIQLLVGNNITKFVAVRNEMQHANMRLETMLANSGDLVFILDKNFIFKKYYNKGDDPLLISNNVFLNKNIADVGFPKDTLELFINAINYAKENDKTSILQYNLLIDKQVNWYDLKISVIKENNNDIGEILCVSRNITTQKLDEIKKEIQNAKTQIYNKILVEFSKSSLATFGSFEKAIQKISKQIAEVLPTCRVSIWNNTNDFSLRCIELYDKQTDEHSNGAILDESKYPIYFKTIKEGKSILANDVTEHPGTLELVDDYCIPLQIKSMMDVPILVAGEFKGIICCEHIDGIKIWSEEDEAFVKTIADYLSIFTEQHLREKAEKKLLRNQKIFEDSYLQAKLGVWEYSFLSKKTYWSDMLKEIFEVNENFQPEYLKNSDFYKDLNTQRRIELLILKNIKTKTPYEAVFEIKTSKGNYKWVRGFGQAEYRNGKCIRLFGALQDIDDYVKAQKNLEESQQQFQYITSTIQDVFWLYNIEEKRTEYISPSCKQILGYDKLDFYNNYNLWKEYVVEEDIQKVENAHLEIYTKDYFEVEYRILINNEIRWIFEKSYAIKNDEGIIYKNSGICIDITSQKNAELQLQKVKEIEETNKSKATFLANMSHEIRTPLNGVIGISDLLSTSNLSEEQAKYVSTIQTSAKILLEVINSILDYSKMEANKLSLINESCNLKTTCHEILELMKFNFNQKDLYFNLEYDDSIPEYIFIDITRLKQVLINIIGNALKFTKKGGVTFYVTQIKSIDEHIIIRLGIRDTGIGIQPEFLDKIFDAFSQEDITTTKKYGGTGLGLTISSKLISLMDSELKVESKLGKGSHFYFDLIVVQDYIPKNKINILTSGNNICNDSIKILLVEDNEVNMYLAKQILITLLPNATIIEVINGLEAYKIFEKELPDLIFMDIQMPILNGYEATKQIRKIEQELNIHTPIIALTAGTIDDEKQHCLEKGMDDLVMKPVVKKMIENVLVKYLRLKFEPVQNIDKIYTDFSSNAHIDYIKLKEGLQQNNSFIKSLMPYVKESLQDGLDELRTHFKNEDIKSINIVAHKIKGTALSACMPKLEKLTYDLEISEDFDKEKIYFKINEIEQEIIEILKLL